MNKNKELIEKIKKGDMEAFEMLYKKYESLLYNYIYRKVGKKEDADDIFQEVFYKVIDNIKKLKHENFKAWIFKIANNTIIDFYRKKKSIPVDEFYEGNGYNNISDDKIDIEKAINKLEDKFKDIIILKFFLDFTFQEVANILKMPLSTVLTRSTKAIGKLKLYFKGGVKSEVSG